MPSQLTCLGQVAVKCCFMKFKVELFAPQKAEETLAGTSGSSPCHLRQRCGQLSLATFPEVAHAPHHDPSLFSYTFLILFMRSLEHLLGQAQHRYHVE